MKDNFELKLEKAFEPMSPKLAQAFVDEALNNDTFEPGLAREFLTEFARVNHANVILIRALLASIKGLQHTGSVVGSRSLAEMTQILEDGADEINKQIRKANGATSGKREE